VCSFAAFKGRFECLKYLHEKGAPFDGAVLQDAVYGRNEECIQFVQAVLKSKGIEP
jgi:hypothetical protein